MEAQALVGTEVHVLVLVKRDPDPLDQMLGPHVLVDGAAPEETGADGHGRRQVGLEAGGADAYFGYPAEATAEEGAQTIAMLGRILEDAVVEALGLDDNEGETR